MYQNHKKKNSSTANQIPGAEVFVRVRLPQRKEIIGVISKRLGGSRMYVSCMDGKTRNCRVPGGKRRELWLREGDVVLVEPWEFDAEKADIIYKYNPGAVEKLKQMGKLQTSQEEF